MQKAILEAIVAERQRQDSQWGGPSHDDHHTHADWIALISKFWNRARRSNFTDSLIKIAALCVAALESEERKSLPMQKLLRLTNDAIRPGKLKSCLVAVLSGNMTPEQALKELE